MKTLISSYRSISCYIRSLVIKSIHVFKILLHITCQSFYKYILSILILHNSEFNILISLQLLSINSIYLESPIQHHILASLFRLRYMDSFNNSLLKLLCY